MDKINFNGVKIRQKQDERNYKLARFIPNVNVVKDEEFMLKLPELEVILDQSYFNACVGHSFATAKSILEYNLTNKWIDIDPFMIYGTRKEGDYDGEGMYSDQAAYNLYKEGAYLRRDFGIREEMPVLKQTVKDWKIKNPDKVKDALNLRISGYGFVNTVDQIKSALIHKMPVSVTYPMYNSFYDTGVDGIVSEPDDFDKIEGYHQMTIVGWTKNKYWIVINSWGINYGMKGLYFIPFTYEFDNAIAISDTISPIRYKAKNIRLGINNHKYYVDNEEKYLDSVPFIKHERTFLPVRFICEALGASVEWIQDEQKVIIRSEEAVIEMVIGSKNFIINGKPYKNDVAPFIVNERTMLPIRIIAETLNCKVMWYDFSREVEIIAK